MILLITKQNCLSCARARILLQDHNNYIELDRNYVSSSILEMGNGEYPMVFTYSGGYQELEKHILHSQ